MSEGVVPPRSGRRPRRIRTLILVGVASVAAAVAAVVVSVLPAEAATTAGIDVSHYQGSINWKSVKSAGIQFAYIKATEGTGYRDPTFSSNYTSAYYAGVIRGAYHFARPNLSSGTTQANYLADHGGAWSADNLTLPAALDIEYNPSGATCYGLSQASMRTWISDFLNRYKARTGRYAVIYSTTNWWSSCTGNYSGFANNHPLWLARYASAPGTLPSGWGFQTIWQYTSSGRVSGISGNVDRNYFNGTRARLLALANNTK